MTITVWLDRDAQAPADTSRLIVSIGARRVGRLTPGERRVRGQHGRSRNPRRAPLRARHADPPHRRAHATTLDRHPRERARQALSGSADYRNSARDPRCGSFSRDAVAEPRGRIGFLLYDMKNRRNPELPVTMRVHVSIPTRLAAIRRTPWVWSSGSVLLSATRPIGSPRTGSPRPLSSRRRANRAVLQRRVGSARPDIVLPLSLLARAYCWQPDSDWEQHRGRAFGRG